MILRVQSKNGTKRIQTEQSDTLQRFLEKVKCWDWESELHGDMLYLAEKKPSGVVGDKMSVATVEEERVDCELAARDGKIRRKRDPQLCHHGAEGKCMNCAPLDPWDPSYLSSFDPPIKHLSFHCYLRKLTSGVDRGKFLNLEDLRCKIRESCPDHPPWPAGICTKCQPSTITLSRQLYRHVDNVMFDHTGIVDRFLDGWRRSGRQRIGFLLGKYEVYDHVPLGIQAVVSAIYEPPQVGWIFTDLEPDGRGGKVAYKRSIHTHLLTAEECILAADLQNKYPNPCKHSAAGYFGSKFTTLCISGNEKCEVEIRGYQVRVDTRWSQSVSQLLSQARGEYGTDVMKEARPLPLEYLIIELTTTSPCNPQPLLPAVAEPLFPVENRAAVGQAVQDPHALSSYLTSQSHSSTNFLCLMADFHLLLFLFTSDVAGIHMKTHIPSLCRAILEGDRAAGDAWRHSEHWSTIEQLVAGANVSPVHTTRATTTAATSGEQWSCVQCTLLNAPGSAACDACQFPRVSS
ncbi:Nuclear protein localization protein 4 homolog [Geodia barretti]|uniref:Nuclear protein localization protein 4 homolog n=1 Tax=Geodia barretti TaxID=519541 RepID=A0AA35XC61_GEOBA|nr:Nuclear protein localization protein 4 homolog [Geodia barretti]